MPPNDSLSLTRNEAMVTTSGGYIFLEDWNDFFFGSDDDASEHFFPEEVIEIVDPDGPADDRSLPPEDRPEWH